MQRKALGRKLRFEVFKRDSFTCQYCGGKAPEVVLHVDHIVPVAEGGANEITNLTTSCVDCNGGKGARLLSDNATVERKRAQLELLQERREQMKMIHEWHEELLNIADEEIQFVVDEIATCGQGFTPNESGLRLLRNWIKAYGFEEVLRATRESFERYFKDSKESWEEAFSRIVRVVKWKRAEQKYPGSSRYLYVTGILRNKNFYIGWDKLNKLYEAWKSWDFDVEDLIAIAKISRNWTQFWQTAAARTNEAAKRQDAEEQEIEDRDAKANS